MFKPNHVRSRKLRAGRLTALVLALLFAPPLWIAPAALAAPGNGWGYPGAIPGVGAVNSLGTSNNNVVEIESDRDGNVFAVFDGYNGSGYNIYANRFSAAGGWAGAFQLNTASFAFTPSLATDPYGNAFVAWRQYNGTAYVVGYSFYSRASGWFPPRMHTVNYTGGSIQSVNAAMDGQGNGYFAARYYNGTAYELWAASVNMNGTQEAQQVMNPISSLYQFALTGSTTSGAILALSLYNGTYDIWAVRHVPGTGWLPAVVLDISTATAYNPQVGFDDSGLALVHFQQGSSGFVTQYATWSPTDGWSATRGAITSISIGQPIMAVAPSGVAVVAYFTHNGTTYVPGATRYVPGAGWQTPVRSNDSMSTYGYTDVSIDREGNAFYVYTSASPGQARGAEFTFAGWGTPGFVLEDSATYDVYAVRVASMGHGKVMASAREWNGGNYQARVNFYSALDRAIPWVVIDRPFSGASYGDGFARVTGWAEPGTFVTVNGATALVFPNGSYIAVVPISEGVNVLQARSTDAAGNSAYSNNRTVTQTSGTLLLEAEHAQAGRSGWLDPIRMENLSLGEAWWPIVRGDSQGNAWVVWYEVAAGYYSVYASRYTKGVGWGTPTQMRAYNEGNIYDYPKLAVDSAGNALVVWNQYNPTNSNITTWARLWLVTGGWQPELRLDNASQYSIQPEVAASSDGQFAATWRQYDSPAQGATYVQFYNLTTGWENRTRITDPVNLTHVPVVTFNSTGVAYVTAAWRVGSLDRIILATHPRGGSWSNISVIQNLSSYIATGAVIRTGLGGNYTIAWSEQRGSIYDTRAGRFMNGSWQGSELLFANAWTWWPEVTVDAQGYSYVAHTESSTGVANAWVSVSRPGFNYSTAVILDNGTEHGGGPRLVTTFDRMNVSVLWDEVEGGSSRGNWRSYDKVSGTWSPVKRISPDHVKVHIPDGAPTPDGGYIVAWIRDDLVLGGINQVDGVRYVPPETNPPSLVVTTPSASFVTTVDTVRVQGVAEVGSAVTINGVMAAVAPNGSFALDIALVNGTNSIYIVARDAAGNTNGTWRNGTFNDPDRQRIAQLEADKVALQNQLNATNSSLWQALNGQNASLLAALAAQNVSLTNALLTGDAALLAQLIAQNASLMTTINGLNQSLLASLAAQNTALLNLIAQTNASLLAELAAQDASLQQLLADTNAALLAELAEQNDDLLQAIASTNATLFAALADQNADLLDQLGELNATLLAALAAGDASLASQLAATNASLLAALAAGDANLASMLASTNASLLASLAAQNDDLLDAIAATNASLLLRLASTNATLWAKITADTSMLWAEVNASAALSASAAAAAASTQVGLDSTNNTVDDTKDSLANTREDLTATTSTAQGANTMAMLGTMLAIGGLVVGLIAYLSIRKMSALHAASQSMAPTAQPPPVGGVEVVEAAPAKPNHGQSMAAQSEMRGDGETDQLL